MTPISQDTFYMRPNYYQTKTDEDSPYTGRVTCSVPFSECISARGLPCYSHGRRDDLG
jgi:hypothetical protein